ncbi:MAG: DUF3786 domain-containing protein [Firmicutes bacterium]|jgi:hypothetical protein|nr:DUF3786 domain-containing protein [Bacillota bacterium]
MNKSPYNMAVTLELARKAFAAKDPHTMAELSACPYDEAASCFTVAYLGQNYTVSYPAGQVSSAAGKEADLITSILLLHYLSGASGVEAADSWISFKELQGGAIYIDPFQKRAINPLVKGFGRKPEAFSKAAELLGGQRAAFGDLSYLIPVLPRIPLILILWQGDEEFPPNGNILFDRYANTYLHTEDYAQLASQTVYTLLRNM